jgi:hypothetical protein
MAKKTPKPPPPEGRATGPGVKKTKTSQPPKIPTIPTTAAEVSLGVPDNVKVAIASAILAFSEIEQALDGLIWDLTGLRYEDGRLLTEIERLAPLHIRGSCTTPKCWRRIAYSITTDAEGYATL